MSDSFGMVFRHKNNEGFTNFLATSSIFPPLLSNGSLCNPSSFDRHMIQASLLNTDVDERNYD